MMTAVPVPRPVLVASSHALLIRGEFRFPQIGANVGSRIAASRVVLIIFTPEFGNQVAASLRRRQGIPHEVVVR